MTNGPLRDVTNSPPPVSFPIRQQCRTARTALRSSDESYIGPVAEIKDGIYNAEPVTSNEQLPDLAEMFRVSNPDNRPNQPRSARENGKQGEQVTVPSPGEPPTQKGLGPRTNAQQYDWSADQHRFTRSSKLRKKRLMTGSEHSQGFRSEPEPVSHPVSTDRCRAHSLSDLDCVKHLASLPRTLVHHRSPSSDEALEAAARTTFYPLMPCHPSFKRSSTPPGVPSFGTKEAQELRLTPASRSRLANLARKVLRDVEATVAPPRLHDDEDHNTHSSEHHERRVNVPADLLRRMLGVARPVSVLARSDLPRRSSLPRGVRVAPTTGVLIQADDGTHVRGRWGPRTSGHGVGQRTINIHPLSRLRESSGLQEAIQEVEKACEREARAQGAQITTVPDDQSAAAAMQQQDQQDSGLNTTNVRMVNPSVSLSAAQALENERRAVRELEAQRLENARLRAALRVSQFPSIADRSLASDTPVRRVQSDTLPPRSVRFAQLSAVSPRSRPVFARWPSIASTSSPRMVEPLPYVTPTGSRGGGSIPTMESMLEQQERENAIQAVEMKKSPKTALELC